MDRLSERDRRSKRTRDDCDRDHKHRSSHHHHSSSSSSFSHHHRSGRERSHEDREGSRDRDSKRGNEREGSRERDRTKHRDAKRELSDDEELERLYDRDGFVERRHSSSHKRKERGMSEERGDGADKRERRFRPISVQVQDSDCSKVSVGDIVCASFAFREDNVRFYDALVDGIYCLG
ncbi:splicing factor U2af large subunit A-like [Quercus suber]|uniref:splicing factor U2af large subunit A-like n=1 Tax=Quercus suber TaxID=58331 RepID=UPI0032DF1A50